MARADSTGVGFGHNPAIISTASSAAPAYGSQRRGRALRVAGLPGSDRAFCVAVLFMFVGP